MDDPTDELAQQSDAYDEGFRDGCLAMREAAAKQCDARAEGYKTERDKHVDSGYYVRWNAKLYVCESNAQAIRALPLPEPPK